MTDALLQLLGGIPPLLAVFLLAAVPVIEVRGAIPVGLGIYQLPLWQLFAVVTAGNILPALFILYGWDAFVRFLSTHWSTLEQLLQKWYLKTQLKWDAKIEKYGPWALVLFVAVPLPGSGVWSGALAAWIFGLEKKKALLSILMGSVLSSILIYLLTVTGLQIL